MSGPLRTILGEPELRTVVRRLGDEVSNDFPEGIFCVGVLKGSVVFLADLIRQISAPCTVDFLALSAYRSGETRVRVLKDLDGDVSGMDVLLVEDVVDTGLSAHYVLELLKARGARRIEVCTLVNRPARRILPIVPRYIGLEIDNEFLVGYGLDVAGRFRNLATLATGDPSLLSADGISGIFGPGGYQNGSEAE